MSFQGMLHLNTLVHRAPDPYQIHIRNSKQLTKKLQTLLLRELVCIAELL